jgi:hypothetical protein
MALRSAIVGVVALFLCGCGGGELNGRSSPTAASGLPETGADSGSISTREIDKTAENVLVTIQDACDPETFNAALGAGTCVRSGGVTFDKFIDLLTRLGSVGSWHFSPRRANMVVGESFLARNLGGEAHTFTEVEEFGGGIVPTLNVLAGTPNVAPECLTLSPADFIAPGATFQGDIEDEEEVEHYQCCIHPWMKLEAQIREK